MKDKNKRSGIILIGIALILMSISVYQLVIWKNDQDKMLKNINRIKEAIKVTEIREPKQVVATDDANNLKPSQVDIDLNKLKLINPDTIGWIQLKGTNIDYPFVKSIDNNYYLNHTFDRTYNRGGWVWLDYRNDIDNLGWNTIIYAHNRTDGTMFGTLKKTLSKDWYLNKENHVFNILTSQYHYFFQVFSVYNINNESYYITTNFNSNNNFLTFLDIIKKRSIYNFEINLNENDRVLTLSTCNNNFSKTVLHAKLIKFNSNE